MALNMAQFGEQETLNTSAADGDERGRWWTPEPVRLAPTPAAKITPTRFDVITGSFQFPADLVEARAQGLVQQARRSGERHTLSLWESSLRDALEDLAREAAHAPGAAECAALFWERAETEYRVAVTFALRRTLRQ